MVPILTDGELWVKPAQDLILSSDPNGHEGFGGFKSSATSSSLSLPIFVWEA